MKLDELSRDKIYVHIIHASTDPHFFAYRKCDSRSFKRAPELVVEKKIEGMSSVALDL